MKDCTSMRMVSETDECKFENGYSTYGLWLMWVRVKLRIAQGNACEAK